MCYYNINGRQHEFLILNRKSNLLSGLCFLRCFLSVSDGAQIGTLVRCCREMWTFVWERVRKVECREKEWESVFTTDLHLLVHM